MKLKKPHTVPLSTPKGVLRVLCALAVSAMLALTGCIYDTPADDPTPTTSPLHYYITLNVEIPNSQQSRDGEFPSGPNGGNNGNGTLTANANERVVNNAILIIYPKSLNGKLTVQDKVTEVLYFDKGEQNGDVWTAKVPINFIIDDEMKAEGKVYKAIVITNVDNISSTFVDMSLPRLRDYILEKTYWTVEDGATCIPTQDNDANYGRIVAEDVSKTSNFVMVSIQESDLSFAQTSSNPNFESAISSYKTSDITVERLAARIDLGIPKDITTGENQHTYWDPNITFTVPSGADNKGILFPVSNGSAATGGYVLINSISLVKSNVDYSYMIKRTADDSEGLINKQYFGTETASSNAATNYVISPELNSLKLKNFKFNLSKSLVSPVLSNDINFYTLGYTNESTNGAKENCTALVLTGYYSSSGDKDSNNRVDFSATKADAFSHTAVIRHSDPTGNGNDTDPMHFGVVRNNVYRIYIKEVVKISANSLAVVWYYYDGTDYKKITTNIETTVQSTGTGEGTITPND